jgi:hypothetical protein
MKNVNHIRSTWVGIATVFIVAGLHPSIEASPQPGRAIVTGVKGVAEYQLEGETVWNQLAEAMALSDGITVRTAKAADLELVLTTRALVRVKADASLRIDTLTEDIQGPLDVLQPSVVETELTLQSGSMAVEVAKGIAGSSFLVRTPLGTIRTMGAKFVVSPVADGQRYNLHVLDGSANVELPDGQTVVVAKNQCISGKYNPKTGKCVIDPQAQPVAASADTTVSPHDSLSIVNRNAGLTELVMKETGPVDLEAMAKLVSTSGGFRPITAMKPKPPQVSKSHPAHGGGGGP